MTKIGEGLAEEEKVPTDRSAKTLEAADIAKVLQALPHRYPFLMVDRIRDIDGDDSGIGIKNVTFNEPHFLGHFPGHPVMPGVLLIEGMAQTAGALCVLAQGL
jgi:3-hydroxyacyl-[acyl-carrier-protein] dehydratase